MINWLSIKLWWYVCGALGIALTASLLAYYVRGTQLERARVDIKGLEGDVRQAKVTIAGYQQATKECTAATKALEQASAERQAKADESLARLRKEADRYADSNKRLALLSANPSPPGGCASALGAIRKELRK